MPWVSAIVIPHCVIAGFNHRRLPADVLSRTCADIQ